LTICNPVRHLPGHREAGTAPWGYRQPCQVLKPEGFHGRIGFPNLFRPNQRSPSRKDPQRSVTDKQRRQRALPSQTEPLPIFRQTLSVTRGISPHRCHSLRSMTFMQRL